MTAIRRRSLLLGLAASAAALPLGAVAAPALPPMHVLKDPNCGCCDAWVAILREDGFAITIEEVPPAEMMRRKLEARIPRALVSCHTGLIDGYAIEGHVPPADIRRLLAERPQAIGLSVPGMPFGSPGMGPEDRRDAYEVVLIGPGGTSSVFASYAAA
ncbi:DUF411 domain-containing protein [Histidinibacterium lentulum]|uniref:DUF411 domain-containing protein n=1 Tax=Histidinibacterium lentulum TaxID=2480588 RepID=A0A3N2R585_9RHOB|nr:DUF411 domain-containing protein [Histidinibacterium lentulum]ROU02594.1 DUF411 domain-containing protein [Histidinibacterium lentulum]